jgi:hypothetical protein
MVKKDQFLRAIERRFEEAFLIDPEKSFSSFDFDFFIKRAADYYQLVVDQAPEFIAKTEKEVESFSVKKNSENEFLKKVRATLSRLKKDREFIKIYKNGERLFKDNLGREFHHYNGAEAVYLEFFFLIDEFVAGKAFPSHPVVLKDFFLSLRRLILEIKGLNDNHFAAELLDLEGEIDRRILLSEEEIFQWSKGEDFFRKESQRRLQELWEHEYGKSDKSVLSLILISARKDKNEALRNISELKLHLHRFHRSLMDWLDCQVFIEEALYNFKVWAEVVNNEEFVRLYQGLSQGREKGKKEAAFKALFTKFMFFSYQVLTIAEPGFQTKRPDFIIPLSEKQIVVEVKILENDVDVERKIKQGIEQLKSYQNTLRLVGGAVLVLFNFCQKKALDNDLIQENLFDKPFFLLPINIFSKPSSSRAVHISKEEIKKTL